MRDTNNHSVPLTRQGVEMALNYMMNSEAFSSLHQANINFWHEVLCETGRSDDDLMIVARRMVRSGEKRAPSVGQMFQKLLAISPQEAISGPTRQEVVDDIRDKLKRGLRPITDEYGRFETSGGRPVWLKFDPDYSNSQCIGISGREKSMSRYMRLGCFAQQVIDWDSPGMYRKLFGLREEQPIDSRATLDQLGEDPTMMRRMMRGYKQISWELFTQALGFAEQDPQTWRERLNPLGWKSHHHIYGKPQAPEVLPAGPTWEDPDPFF